MTSTSNSSQEQNRPFSRDDFAKALEQHDYQFEKGKVVKGKTFQHISDGAYVDIGGKSPGFVPAREASLQRLDLATALPLQSEMTFLITSEQDQDGQVTLSRRQLELKEAWDELSEIAASGKSVQMRVSGVNKGGVTGEVNGMRAFIPRSHLSQKDNLDSLMDQVLTANFLEIDPNRNKLVLSQRQAARADAIGQLAKGALLEGKIVSIKPYGLFVDLNGITGLLHIKQISSNHIDSLDNLFRIGAEIKVIIIEVDESKNRVSLSTRLLESYPGEMLEKMDEVMNNAEERADKAKAKLLGE